MDVAAKVPDLRTAFKEKCSAQINAGAFDKRDLERLDTDDAYARCFLRTMKSKGDVDKACDVIKDCFVFRKENAIWDLTESSFPDEILSRKAIYYKNKDVGGHPILYMKVKDNSAKGAEEMALLKKFIAYNFEQHHRTNPEQMCVVLFDMTGAGTGNVNMEVTKFVISCFTHYFPAYLAYLLNYEMPLLLSATWKLISAFLSKEQSGKILQVKKKDIAKYLSADNLWDHMK